MGNNIKTFMAHLGGKDTKTMAVFILALAVVGIALPVVLRLFASGGKQMTAAVVMSDGGKNGTTFSDIVAVVGGEEVVGGTDVGSSWPGEIISAELAQIQPQRQGVIVDWRVNVGDAVSAGDILGKISAPPATPELIKMLAEQTEGVARAKAEVIVADEFSAKEQERLTGLQNALRSDTASSPTFSFTALLRMREKIETAQTAMRAFVERAVSDHIAIVSTAIDFRNFQPGRLNGKYGSLNPSAVNAYESSLLAIIGALKNATDISIEDAQKYFADAVRLANSSGDDEAVNGFKITVAEDQKEFLDLLGDYRDAKTELADKETEYQIMISERSAMVEKDRSLAHAEATAAEAAYATVSREINGGLYIISPRAGTISAIYKKVGDLVIPEMPIAVVTGYGDKNLIVRVRIPGNIQKPVKGDTLSVMRPGFPNDVHQATLIGIGTSLDETGSYMADAVLTDRVDWPSGASVRVISPASASIPTVTRSSVWWNSENIPHVWGVSEAGRVFARKITIGRTLGNSVGVYEGMKKGDRYIARPTAEIRENIFLDDLVETNDPTDDTTTSPTKSGGHEGMEGMEM